MKRRVYHWWVGVALFEPVQAEGTMHGFVDAAQTGDSSADQGCDTDTDHLCYGGCEQVVMV